MDEKTARAILGSSIQDDGSLRDIDGYFSWHTDEENIDLDGTFSPDTLLAICWWVEHKAKK